VSHQRKKCVPPPGREEQAGKKTGYARARFANRGGSFGEIPDDRAKWEARLRSWHKSRFWLPSFGPKPTEPGCFAPAVLLKAVL
jgi:hypothetical protein